MSALLNYLRLYRADVALLSFVAVLGSAFVAGELLVLHVVMALLVALVSMNFVYSYNACGDVVADKVNKPWRILASGTLSLKQARVYCYLLFGLSLLWPLAFYRNVQVMLALQLVPILGWLYSTSKLRLRQNLMLSLLTAALIWIMPMGAAYKLVHSELSLPLAVVCWLFFLALLPLKDFTDVRGDRLSNYANWVADFGSRPTLLFSTSLSLINLCIIGLLDLTLAVKLFVLFVNAAVPGCILFSVVSRRGFDRLYQRVLGSLSIGVPILCILLWIE